MNDSYQRPATSRSAEMRAGPNGRLTTNWRLTDTKQTDPVQVTVPPQNAIPIIFVPGIMGSNLSDTLGRPVWLLNAMGSTPIGLAVKWSRQDAGVRQQLLHPARTKVFSGGNVPASSTAGLTEQDFLNRGWGEVSQASYHKFLRWLDQKMNAHRDPTKWEDFSYFSGSGTSVATGSKLLIDRVMEMRALPAMAEIGVRVEPVTSNELLMRAKSTYPIYAYGYNWLDSNTVAADGLKSRIEKIIAENNGRNTKCTQVILVTHSMGGLVARACAQLPDMSRKILGIVHGVMPATGAAVAYRRCKVGMRDEDFAASLVIGSNGREVSAVFAQAPGALQLLPSEGYGKGWLSVSDQAGNLMMSLPKNDPYDEIYLERKKWWGLLREEWLSPPEGKSIDWGVFVKNINTAREFHRQLAGAYHENTYVFYGGGSEKQSFQKIRWNLTRGTYPATKGIAPSAAEVLRLANKDVRTDGSNNLYVGGETRLAGLGQINSPPVIIETSFWEIHCAKFDSDGDGTVPTSSGGAPRSSGGRHILQQFSIADVQHEPAYRDYPLAQQIAYYAITKLSALANLK